MKIATRILAGIAILLVIGLLTSAPKSEASDAVSSPISQVIASEAVTPKLSRPVRDIPSRDPEKTLNREINPIRNPGLFMEDFGLPGSNTTDQDPLVALSQIKTGDTPDPIFTFEGLGTDGYTPPDTMGEVGPNHYVQMVNVSFAIYDKTGAVVVADTPFTDLFAGSGLASCSTQNDGDPVVVWDSMADRWLLSQFAVSTSPYHMCIAISQTADPTGAYYLYEFAVPDFPDYFKFGVWPDAYYMGTNTGFPNQYYAYAFDRNAMLNGQAATYQYSNGWPNFLLPADLDGSTPPPAGTPGYFYTMLAEGYPNHPAGVDRIVLYEFDVDWNTPSNSTFGVAQEMPIADYNYTTCGFFAGDCIPQPGTSQKLDGVDQWPMWRFAYRNLSAYEAMVGNFTVDTNGADHAGIRWFELQRQGASAWTLYQEGTHSPDTDHRWMGSIAMDGSGDIALGYSVSSSTTYPSLRYATHSKGDAAGTMQTEATLYAGNGSQTGPYDRWGDYSSMSIDPADDCTFWYTGEYHDVSDTSFNWNTRIGTFRLPECTGSIGASGTLMGNVTDNITSNPVEDVTIYATNGFTQTGTTTTDVNGDYSMNLLVGTYDVTASAFGYLPTNVTNVDILSGTITTLDMALDPAPSYTISGTVTDALTGWPLYARINIAGYPGDPLWTDPVSGFYSIVLPEGITYTFGVNAWVGGYLPASVDVSPSSDMTVNFTLDADTSTCTAPGYSYTMLLSEDFEGSFPPAGWTVVDNISSGVMWDRNDSLGQVNRTTGVGGSGYSAANGENGVSGGPDWDTSLMSPPIDLSTTTVPQLSYASNFQDFAGGGEIWLDISTDSGATWVNLRNQTTDDPSSGTFEVEDLSAYSTDTIMLRWRYADTDGSYGWYWHIDNVLVPGDCSPASGGLVVGNVYDDNTSMPLVGASVTNEAGYMATTMAVPNDPAVDDGFYTLFSPAGTQTFTATVSGGYGPAVETPSVVANDTIQQDFSVPAGWLDVSPSAFTANVELGSTLTQTLTLDNLGNAPLSFEIGERAVTAMAPVAGEDVLVVQADTTAATAMETALTNLGYTYLGVTASTFQGMSVPELLAYKAVFHAGNTATATETLVMAYLDAGGSFYVSDNDLGYFNNADAFYQVYLQATYVSDDPGINNIVGENFMTGLSADISADPYPDDFTVGAEGTRILSFEGGNAAGVAVDRNGYLAVYTSFDYDDIASAADEQAFMDAIAGYLINTDIPWISEDPITGTISALGSMPTIVTFDASGADITQPGDYFASLNIRNDSPYGTASVPVTMTVTAPATYGYLEGTVDSDGYCDADPFAIVGATVDIEATGGMTWTLTTDDMGYYSIWLDESNSPLTITVNALDHEMGLATSVTVVGQTTTTQDFNLRWLKPCIGVDPTSLAVTLDLGANTTLPITLTNTGGAALDFTLQEQDGGMQPLAAGAVPADEAPVTYVPRDYTLADITETGMPTVNADLLKLLNAAPIDYGTAWETMAPLPSARVFNAVVADTNGYVYVMGGTSDAGGLTATNTNFRYDTGTNTWATMAAMPSALDSIDGVAINNKIYIPGGDTNGGDTYVYDINTDSWSTIAANGGYSSRAQYQVVAMGTDLYVLGGIAGGSASTTEVWVLDTTTGTWSAGVPMQKSRTSFSAAAINGNIYVAGGVLFPGFTPDMTSEMFDGTSWSFVANVPNGGGTYTRWSYNADGLGVDGLWLGAGRRDAGWAVLNHAGFYDPSTDTWTDSPTVPTLAQGRVYMEGDVATDGYFYVIGGRDSAGSIIYNTNERLEVGYAAGGDVTWLSESPDAGSVPADTGVQVVDVTFDAGSPDVTQPGEYYATLRVVSNDPMYGSYGIPVTMTVNATASLGQLEGTVTSLGYCDTNPAPLADAEVSIESSTGTTWMRTTDASGMYSIWLDETTSPYTVTVAALEHEGDMASGVIVVGQTTTTQDFDLRWLQPCVSVDPIELDVTVAAGSSTVVPLNLMNDGAASTMFTLQEAPGTMLLKAAEATSIESTVPANPITFGDLSISHASQSTGAQATPIRLPQSPDEVTITHSASQTIMSGNSVSCNSISGHTDNSYLRTFTLTDFGIDSDFTVSSVDIGIESATAGSGGTQPATINLYTLDGAFVWTNMTLIGTADITVSDQTLTIINVPVTGLVPANGTLVVEVFTPNGQTDGNFLFVGSNNLGQTAPTYLAAVDCGITDPADTGSIGFPDMHMVMNVTGDIVNQDIPWLSEDPITGTIDMDSNFAVDVTFDTMTYTVGTYTASLKVKTDDPMSPTIDVPVTMHVVNEVYAMEMSLDTHSLFGMPGDMVTATMQMTNTGNVADTYNMVLTSSWPASMDHPASISMMPGETAMVHIMVTIPVTATDGMTDTIGMTVTSVGDSGLVVTDSFMVTAQWYTIYAPFIIKP